MIFFFLFQFVQSIIELDTRKFASKSKHIWFFLANDYNKKASARSDEKVVRKK